MWICPVCNNKIENGLCCSSCHFDMSRNYEMYATLASIDRASIDRSSSSIDGSGSEPVKSILEYRKDYQCEKNPDVSIENEPYVSAFDSDAYLRHTADPSFQQGVKHFLECDFKEAYPCFKEAASNGNILAYAYRGMMFHAGGGCIQSDERAIGEFRKGAKLGCPLAASWLAECYRMGYAVEKDKERGKRLLEKNLNALKEMCRLENVSALYFLGFNLVMGTGMDVDEAEGVRLLNIAASKGSKEAALQLAECYLNLRGVKMDAKEALKKALQLLTQNPLEGNPKYHFLLAICYFCEQNHQKAFEGFKKAAELGSWDARDLLADCYYEGYGTRVDYCKAASWYKDAADHHANGNSAHNLACMYLKGQGVPKDIPNALHYFGVAARNGNVPAQRFIVNEYMCGKYLPQDDTEAKYWMEMAAETGDAEAQYTLGRYYHYDDVEFYDEQKAFEWFSKAAEQGYAEAEYYVGICYLAGSGVGFNHVLANEWFAKALEHGCISAAYELGSNYLVGYGVTADAERGIQLLESVADSKVDEASDACRELAESYHSGIKNFRGEALYKNPSEAKKYAKKAVADETDGDAQFIMAEILNKDFGDTEAAAGWYRKAMNNGNQEAEQELNRMLAERSSQEAAPKKKKHFWFQI